MLDLLSKYSVGEIIIFIVILAIGLKEFIDFMDWAKDKAQKHFNKETDSAEAIQKLEEKNAEQDEKITQILEAQNKISDNMTLILEQIKNLTKSDRDAIKAYITKEHHHFCYEAGWIDDYNLDCIERRFQRYKEEGGNSFIAALMEEIRALPRQPRNTNDVN